jgi:hypothetical protein
MTKIAAYAAGMKMVSFTVAFILFAPFGFATVMQAAQMIA